MIAQKGRKAIDLAASRGHPEMVEFLISIDPSLTEEVKITATDWYCIFELTIDV